MAVKLLMLFLLMKLAASTGTGFTYNGFNNANMSLDGTAEVTGSGLMRLTTDKKQVMGHAFHSSPLQFKNPLNGTVLSFSTSFVFAISSIYQGLGSHGLAFAISRSNKLAGASATQYLGLFNSANDGNSSNHIAAVELDTSQNSEFNDINDNHVGILINGLKSYASKPAAYFQNESREARNLNLGSGDPMQVWVEYNGLSMQLNVTLAPINKPKPSRPLLSATIDLCPIFKDTMFVGFSSSTGSVPTSHYVLGWSFKMNGAAETLDIVRLPKVPRRAKEASEFHSIWLPIILTVGLLATVSALAWLMRRKMKFAELLEDWEHEYGPHRFSYKDLFTATKGFRDKELLGVGSFGRVYKGVLPKSKVEVAVKKVSHGSWQGMREFVAEIVSIGRLRHRNLVQLLGYCRRKGELLLVYDFMPNGSLDKFLFCQSKFILNWSQRLRIIKGVASGLLYLHEEWEQIVIHRDVKASNVLLDSEMNGRLGDFGLARLYDHGSDPQTTHVVGTLGYLAPELARTGKATTSTDVYAFGAFMLEVCSGRRPIQMRASDDERLLVDLVIQHWRNGSILEICDPNLGGDYDVQEMELVLKLGLLCLHPISSSRPSMRQVMQILDRDVSLPEIARESFNATALMLDQEGYNDLVISCSSLDNMSAPSSSSMADSLLFGGR